MHRLGSCKSLARSARPRVLRADFCAPKLLKGATRCDLTRTWCRVAFGRMVRLVISDNEGSTTVVPLLRDEVTIGRKEGNTIRLTERNISRRHVQLVRVAGIYKLRDLDSYNGVLVNGRRVEGESDLNNGDQIQLGDYTIVVEEEAAATARSAAPPPEPSVLSSRRPAVPARLVMLTQPASGAEFVLPTDRSARLGRSDEVDCPINHRSVSREHAEIRREGEDFVIEDLGSANGVTVNGRTVKQCELRSGDIIELGQVVFRYVGAGEHYFFDAGEASRYRGGVGGKKAANMRLALLLGAVTLAAVVFILLPTPENQEDPNDVVATGNGDTTHASTGSASGLVDDGYDKAVLACRSASAAGRFAEAAAHASLALKVRPGAPEATDCKQRADSQSVEEQIFVRGKDALQKGDAETAYLEFERLPELSLFRARPEVSQAAGELARARLHDARGLLPSNRGDAARLAQSVVSLAGAPPESVALAEQILVEARKEPGSVRREPVAAPRPVAAKPVKQPEPARPRAPAPPPVRASEPASQAAAASGPPPMEVASACLARGDNECVIHALEGNASSAQELGLLIETYRAIGDAKQAQKHMAIYVKRFPSAGRAEAYRRMLELQNQ
jgi:ABC transport system ATP-binding/permease protein